MTIRKVQLFLFLLIGGFSLNAAELRMWTSVTGSVVEAKLKKLLEKEVLLVTSAEKEIKVKLSELSFGDRQHLVDDENADPEILIDDKLVVPEEKAKIDKSTFKKWKDKLVLAGGRTDGGLSFDVLETEHFLVAKVGGVRLQAVAEMAERIWHGMAFQHMHFRSDWGDKKMLILLIDHEEAYAALGKWYVAALRQSNDKEMAVHAKRMETLWMELSGTMMGVPSNLVTKHNLHGGSRVFRIRGGDDSDYRKVFGPFPTHGLANALLSHYVGEIGDDSPRGYFTIATGHAYYKEIQLAKKTNTNLLDTQGTSEDEIANARGFEDGTSWAKTLRKMVRKKKVTPNFEKMLTWNAADLTPEQLVTIYSFAYYMEGSPERLVAFTKLVSQMRENDQVPEAVEIAKIFGFDSVAALEEDWIKFIRSTSFK